MKKYLYAVLFVLLLVVTFASGYWFSQRTPGAGGTSGERKVLYYTDPMNPGQRYDKPGVAPCGMALEPVYADSNNEKSGMAAMPNGTVRINTEKQQLIGVRVEPVEKASAALTIRVLGTVAADETRVYQINAYTDGWITKIAPVSTGSLVKKNELLAEFYTPEFYTAQQAYLSILGTAVNPQTTVTPYQQYQIAPIGTNIDKYRDNLLNLGVSESQLDEIAQSRKEAKNIVIRSPAQGFILVRNVSLDQRFLKGSELFRIADLRKVWILLDTYENEARYFRPGQSVQVSYQGKMFKARVSKVLPVFDPSTRTLKVRLEADNPGFTLRPDMFVDVEHTVSLPPAITVPVDAVLDSGLKKTVFVEPSPGYFEPREVETGRYFDGRVEIVKGLKPGEQIVVTGNFLIDSESRMKTATEGMSGTGSLDPSCGMMVDEGKSKAEGLTSVRQGKTYYFCSPQCKQKFDKAPDKYLKKPMHMDSMPDASQQKSMKKSTMKTATDGMPGTSSIDPACGMMVDEAKSKAEGLTSVHQGKSYYFDSPQCKQKFDMAPDKYLKKPMHMDSMPDASQQKSMKKSTMKTAIDGMPGTSSIDPACGMMVDEAKSKAEGLTSVHQGKTYYFDSPQCKQNFDMAPDKYLKKPMHMDSMPDASQQKSMKKSTMKTATVDPACGMIVDKGKSKDEGLTSGHRGKIYYFCSPQCKQNFDMAPDKYLKKPMHMEPMHDASQQNTMKSGGHQHD